LKVGILISGRGSNMQALIEACAEPGFPAETVLVVSNVPGAPGLARAAAAGIATATIDHRPFGGDRAAFESKLTEALAGAEVELVCQAGFMRIVTEGFVRRWWNRLLNIHPSLLPAFPGLRTHERALAAGVRLHGCTVHFVRATLDDGPIVAQAAVPVLPGDTPERLAKRVLAAEHRCYPWALSLVAEGRARVEGARVLLDAAARADEMLINPAPTAP
jgi:phosphoribosylglycinamide formyltransferase-1